jgi:5'-deoxynucleotidase YfbR-like HD superfamily hydrolase
MISPFKAALGLDYKAFEERLEAAIHIRFGLPAHVPAPIKALIKRADGVCAYFEATQLAGFSTAEAKTFFGPPPRGLSLPLKPLAPERAQDAFLARFRALSGEQRP